MSSSREFEGKTVEKAVQKAARELNVSEDALKHEVISFGSTGIFGLVGAKKARIRVILEEETVQPSKPHIPQTGLSVEGKKPADQPPESKPDYSDIDIVDMEAVAEKGFAALNRILGSIVDEVDIKYEINASDIRYLISSPNSAVIIGKRGQTLEAVQYILEKIISKSQPVKVRIQIDVEGYLENKKETLEGLAEKMAEKVGRTGKPVTIGHMNAQDRRIIHMALKGDKRVRTQSMGDGYLKRMVILPKKKRTFKKPIPVEQATVPVESDS